MQLGQSKQGDDGKKAQKYWNIGGVSSFGIFFFFLQYWVHGSIICASLSSWNNRLIPPHHTIG
jgi:hypothetical protein